MFLKAPEAWILSKSVSPPRLYPGRQGGEVGMHGWLGTYSAGLTDRHKEGAEKCSLERSPASSVLQILASLHSTKHFRRHRYTYALPAVDSNTKRGSTEARLDLFFTACDLNALSSMCFLSFDRLTPQRA